MSNADVQKLSVLLDQFVQAVGKDGPMRAAARAIAQAGGYLGIEDIMAQGGDVNGPWRWVSAVVRHGTGDEDPALPARAFIFVTFWTDVIGPKMQMADSIEIGIGPAPQQIQAEVAQAALSALVHLQPQTVIIDSQTGTLNAKKVAEIAADRLLILHAEGFAVDEGAIQAARQILQQ